MGRYIDKTDIGTIFGQVNVAKWSNLDNRSEASSPDVDRINAAIVYAEDYFDDRIRSGVYTVPLDSVPMTVVEIVARLAGVWLYEARGMDDVEDAENDPIARQKVWADRMIDRILRGEIRLSSGVTGRHPTYPHVLERNG